MKIAPRDIESFLRSPLPVARVILVYGPETGLMKERTAQLGKHIVSDLNDPFNSVTLSAETLIEDPARLFDEANALSMMGGGRLIRIESASEKITPILKEYLQNPSTENLIILEGSELGPRSSLRKLCETNKAAAAIPCYVEEERDLIPLINQIIRDNNLRIEQAATVWLAGNLLGNRQRVRGEIEKLILYKGQETTEISLAEAQDCCGDAGTETLDKLIYSTGEGNTNAALQSYTTLLREGTAEIKILRGLQNHFKQLHYIKSLTEQGQPLEQAMKSLQPPIFFKQAPSFKAQTRNWGSKTLERTIKRLHVLEAECKKTNAPVETLFAQALLSISMRAGKRR